MDIPSNYSLQGVRNLILKEYGGLIDELFLLSDAHQCKFEIPALWLKIKDQPQAEVIEALWGKEDGHFPRMVDYMRTHLIGLFVGKGIAGVVLVYFLQNYEHFKEDDYLDGSILAGIPASETAITVCENTVGILPVELKALWRMHNFMYLVNQNILCGPEPSVYPAFSGIRNVGIHQDIANSTGEHECLAICDTWSYCAHCLIRNPKELEWKNQIIKAETNGYKISPYRPVGLDEFISREW